MATTTYVFPLDANVRLEAYVNTSDLTFTIRAINETTGAVIVALSQTQTDRLIQALAEFQRLRMGTLIRSVNTA